MAIAVYTRRLAAAQLQAVGEFVLLNVDLVADYVLRDVVVANQAQQPVFYSLFIRAGTSVYSIMVNQALAPGSADHWSGRQRLLSPEQLVLYTNTTPISALVTGYAFTPVA